MAQRTCNRLSSAKNRQSGLWLVVLIIAAHLFFNPTSLDAQSCRGNPNTGCVRPGAACRPVTTGTGAQGRCTTPKGLPKGELSCECAGTPAPLPPPPPLFDEITYPAPPAGTDVSVRIDRPNPTQHSTEYPRITFQPGDTVTIHAGGCVQGGGSGRTWRQYVDPTQSDYRYYHGLISIPFATQPLVRIQSYADLSVHIVETAPVEKLHLELGYEDATGAYGDNGYYSHDDGPGNQCAGADGGPAWVRLDIVHHGPAQKTGDGGDWDLLWTDYDPNSIPLNPDWRTSVNYGKFPDPVNCIWPWMGSGLPKCTTQISNRDTYWACSLHGNVYDLPGHANYMAATYTGYVSWEAKSLPKIIPGEDDEYSVNLTTLGQDPKNPARSPGANLSRTEGVHIEFDSDETIDVLTDDFQIPWWQGLRNAVDVSDSQAHDYLDNKYVQVTGFMGLDFAHSPGPESHPAWSMAVQGYKDPATEIWAFFVRNWGNEGYCSGDQHYVTYLDNEFTFNLPWPAGAVSGSVATAQFSTNQSKPGTYSVTFIPGKAAQVTFYNLADPSEHALIGGELHIAWAGAPAGGVTHRPSPPLAPIVDDFTGTYAASLVSRLTAAQRAVYLANVPAFQRVKKPASALRVQQGVPVQGSAARRPQLSNAADTAVGAHKDAQIGALTKAYGGALPPPPPK